MRRYHAQRIRQHCSHVWPILESAGKTPKNWSGWPDGKQFAFVLTHDVEGRRGLDRVKPLAELEMKLGFRSSFGFVPEGEYRVPAELRDWLTDHGFEVHVHDLHHDGKLFKSRSSFKNKAQIINRYLEEWNAVGFRAGFMLHRLDWIHDLNIEYDASTFDSDPFEPQPDGVGNIFPFWVSNSKQEIQTQQSEVVHHQSNAVLGSIVKNGYIELPYTLSQDSTLFLYLEEKGIDIWKRKSNWLIQNQGVVLLNSHPDFMRFSGESCNKYEYPVDYYRTYLEYIRNRYSHELWNVLPCNIARFYRNNILADSQGKQPNARTVQNIVLPRSKTNPNNTLLQSSDSRKSSPNQPLIWIDLDNTPHVPFFKPIIRELQNRGYQILTTARDAFQVCDLADKMGVSYLKVGRHHGKNRIAKITGLCWRAYQLSSAIKGTRPVLGLSHGSRSQILLCNFKNIPTVLIADYEYAKTPPFMRPTYEIIPDIVPEYSAHIRPERIKKYPGIKEDVYVPDFIPNPSFASQLGIRNDAIVVTVRPPATEAHYHNPESVPLLEEVMKLLLRDHNCQVIMLPRNQKQLHWMQHRWPCWFESDHLLIPQQAMDGLNILWCSDLVISGGGTMNREAAALGIPVYSIFRGSIGAVDRQLSKDGRLILLTSREEVAKKLKIVSRQRPLEWTPPKSQALHTIIDHVHNLLVIGVKNL